MYKIWECTVMPLNLKCVNSASRGVRILLAGEFLFGVGARSPQRLKILQFGLLYLLE